MELLIFNFILSYSLLYEIILDRFIQISILPLSKLRSNKNEFQFLFSNHSTYVVFLVAGLVLICVFGLIMLEKVKFLPKQILSISAYASNNKVMHQILAATNVLSLFACVLVPLVSPQKFRC